MKHLKKGLAALLVMGVVGLGSGQVVDACNVTSSCNVERTTMICGIPTMVPTAHRVPDGNGGGTYCYVIRIRAQHSYTCDGCGATVSTDADMKTCSETHSSPYCVDFSH